MKIKLTSLYLMIFVTITFAVTDSTIISDNLNEKQSQIFIEGEAKSVIDNYFEAIGGIEKYKSVYDRTTYMSGFAMEQIIWFVSMQKAPSLLYQEISSGDIKQLIFFDGNSGTMIMGPNTVEIEGAELERLKLEAAFDLLLYPEKYGVTINYSGIELIDSVNCHKLIFESESGAMWFQYFETKTGLKKKQTKEIETPQGSFEQETFYSDYRDVNGIKYPFTIVQTFGMQIIELGVDSIKVNTGLEDSVFKLPE